ncbi:MAG: hypothetical protein BWK76_13630 [Desulfobulbaceae bacterium A2]|nr:MAG: hypothetical protein BWK76_13630 [Desulfobulbaceae bacterium A2]
MRQSWGITALCGGICLSLSWSALAGQDDRPGTGAEARPLLGTYLDRADFPNPYAHIPAQCYIETSGGSQNACQYCHTDSLAKRRFGNNTPQAGSSPVLGNLIESYAFAALRHPFQANGSVNPWENTLFPERLRGRLADSGQDPAAWDMQVYIREDNWSPAFAQRPGDPRRWDAGVAHPMRLFPGLDPADLPAGSDGYVRSAKAGNGFFHDGQGWISGWRAVNFVPYGIFTPLTGSVSGIYLRLPQPFMRDAAGDYSLAVYSRNLDLLARAVQDRLRPEDPAHYEGAAATVPVEPGLYPLGTEFAHPLHYVDLAADGAAGSPSPFPGTRARRVKEIRYMYKAFPWDPRLAGPETKEEDAPVRAGVGEGWIDNGAGWILAGYIEDTTGELRPQTPSELVQCVGCHSGNAPQPEKGHAAFASGTGNTVDSTWALVRQLPGADGWREMDAMGYVASADGKDARSTRPEPRNRKLGVGEYRYFLDTVVGVSLYGEMPGSVEQFLSGIVRRERGYSADWPQLDFSSAEALLAGQKLRQNLMRELTARGEHLTANGGLAADLLYPTQADALAGAVRYRQVVVTQRYDFGKDVFDQVPFTFHYHRTAAQGFSHQDGRPYHQGEIITDRPINTDPASLTWGVGIGPTLIKLASPADPTGNYEPLLAWP